MEYLTSKPGVGRSLASLASPGKPSGANSGVKIACVLVTYLRAKVEMRKQPT